MAGVGQAAPVPSPRWKKRLLWSGAVAGLILLLVFVPPLINANRYHRQIATSMSQSLGRPVHLDNVKLHLLPVPGLTLTNLVVSEDPAFGDEPTIRADSVEATLRLGSLWRRRVEFSTVRFIEPHVNLVRNSEGRWNLANVLLHAAHVETAPTAQPHAGPTPRFPYIEATGGRVNIKLSEEKLPFAITDADFALWLPSPQQWRVRLTGQPARTDMNINDPGILRIEGDLQRAATAAQIPVDLRVTWHGAPMGEASRLLAANDMGWRGALNFDASLVGTLGAGRLSSKLTLGGLRRADFAPAQPLDLQITCGAGISVVAVTISDLQCAMPDGAPTPMVLQTTALNLQHPEEAEATVSGQAIPVRWALLWAALFSPRVPTDLRPAGLVTVNFTHSPASQTQAVPTPARTRRPGGKRSPVVSPTAGVGPPWNQWTGEIQIALPAVQGTPPPSAAAAAASPASALPLQMVWRTGPPLAPGVLPGGNGLTFRLQPLSVRLATDAIVTANAVVAPGGYLVSVAGTASPAALLLPARYLPQLGDGFSAILPFPPTGLAAARVDFTCTHPWGALQTCNSLRPAPPGAKVLPVGTSAPRERPLPGLLTPRSLSPLDQSSPLGQPAQPPSPRF